MERVVEYIKKHNLIKSGEVIAVACSGGRDSICLLHFLNYIKADLDCEIVAVNVDHGIRAHSALDTEFVMQFCKDHKIRSYKFKAEALKVAKEEGLSIEQAARKVRYGVFETLIKKGLADKIALAHHMQDQAETVLLNIIRGAGLSGARGMEPVRDGIYIRPFLELPREEIMSYLDENGLEYVEDETNKDNSYSRNYIRNIVIPALRKHFKGVDKSIVNFSKIVSVDEEYINSQIDMGTLIEGKDLVKIPLSYFYQHEAVVNRILKKVFARFSKQDIESKHIRIVREFAIEANNGNVINLPFKINVAKEYDYITIGKFKAKAVSVDHEFRNGKMKMNNYGTIRTTSSKVLTEPKPHQHIIDADRLDRGNAVWRYRKEGDVFTPLGMTGSKKLKEYFIDKKVPQRMRDNIPLLAIGNKILVVADIEIADELKVTENTRSYYKINYEKDFM